MTLYEQVAGKVEELIAKGLYEPGEQLPSIRKLSLQFRVSVNTIREAYRILENRHIVSARAGAGYYVTHLPPQTPVLTPDVLDDIAPQNITIDDLSHVVLEDGMREDLVALSLAVPPPSMLPTARLGNLLAGTLRKRSEDAVSYDIAPGRYSLRQNIARRMFSAGCSVSVDEIVLTSGCFDALTITLLAICRSGDTVAIESPVFFGFLRLLESLGLRIIELPSAPRTGVNLDVLEFILDNYKVSACITIPNFGNPLGSLMPDENKERLVRMAETHGVPLIEDDIYGELHFGVVRPRVLKAWDTSGNVILCSSFTKTIAPGFRVGWVAGGRFSERITRTKATTSLAAASPSEIVVETLLESGGFDRYLRSVRRAYKWSMEQVSDAVVRHFPAGTRVSQPQGGLVLWVELPAEIDTVELYYECRKQGVNFAPGVIFSTSNRYRNFIRICSAEYSPRVESAISTIAKTAAEQLEKKRTLVVEAH